MALETLKELETIGGFKIVRKKPDNMPWEEFDKTRDEYPINITERLNTISFKIQNGPVKENGVNGCQVDTLIHAAKHIIEKLNENFPSSYNLEAIGNLNKALASLQKRKEDRENRGVEGFNKA